MNSQTTALSRYAQGAPVTAGWLAGMIDTVSRFLTRIRHWRQVRHNIVLLSSLDDKVLADVGIMRDQVEYVARLGYVPEQSQI